DPGTTYSFYITAFNDTGESNGSNTATATTESVGSGIPAPPFDLHVTFTSSNEIDLAWQAGDNFQDGLSISDAGNNQRIANVGADTFNYDVINLDPDTTYSFYITAFNNDGESDGSNVVTATTNANGSSIPAPPFNLTVTFVSASEIDLAWQAGDNLQD